MDIQDMLDHAFASHIGVLFGNFIDSVTNAEDKESEIIAAAERFKAGVNLAKKVLEKARQIVEN